jgi:transposase
MIGYQTYCQIRHLFTEKRLGLRQIARELKLGLNTVRKWARRERFEKAKAPKRSSKLDPFKGEIIRLLEQHDYSAQQIFQQLQERGYQGRYSILKVFVRQVRPKPRPAFLTLHFEPGECAQVDWGCAGSVPVGSTRRRLSFFLMVLAFSRKLYLEFTLAETLEHFLSCHQHAFEYFDGVVRQVWVDNCKVTQAQFARALGCSVEFVSLVERGVNAPSVARLEDFARALKVEVVDLFTFTGRKPTRIRRLRISKGGVWQAT